MSDCGIRCSICAYPAVSACALKLRQVGSAIKLLYVPKKSEKKVQRIKRSMNEFPSKIPAAGCRAIRNQIQVLNSSWQRCRSINPSSRSGCLVATPNCSTFCRLMQLVQFGGAIEEQIRSTPAPLSKRQLKMFLIERETPYVIRSL